MREPLDPVSPLWGHGGAEQEDGVMSERGWKKAERRMAKKLGGTRIPVTGERAGIDIDAGPFVYQLKVRQGMPGYLRKWLDGICGQADQDGASVPMVTGRAYDLRPLRTGVVIWKSPRAHDDNAVVVLRFSDWVALHGK